MKNKVFLFAVIMCLCVSTLVSCDRDFNYYVSVEASDSASVSENVEFTGPTDILRFHYSELNGSVHGRYTDINFENIADEWGLGQETFYVRSNVDGHLKFELDLYGANSYLRDCIRIGLIIDGQLHLYKQNDIDKYPDGMTDVEYFEKEWPIFDYDQKASVCSIEVDSSVGDIHKVTICFWSEYTEDLDRNGEHYTGHNIPSHHFTWIDLRLNIE